MHVSVASDISVLARLSGSQIDQLAAVFRSAESASAQKAREIAGADFTDADIGRIVRSFHVFLGMTKTDVRRLAGSSSLGADKMPVVCAAIGRTPDGSDAERLERAAANAESGTDAQCGIERPRAARVSDYPGERSGYNRKSRDLLSLFGLKPGKNPPPTIRGMLEGYAIDKDSLTLVREMRDG